jgi:hypothetical protein
LNERNLSKRGLARLLAADENSGDPHALAKWERLVYLWTSDTQPGGLSEKSREHVLRVLDLPPNYFTAETVLEKRQAFEELAERVARIERHLGLDS